MCLMVDVGASYVHLSHRYILLACSSRLKFIEPLTMALCSVVPQLLRRQLAFLRKRGTRE